MLKLFILLLNINYFSIKKIFKKPPEMTLFLENFRRCSAEAEGLRKCSAEAEYLRSGNVRFFLREIGNPVLYILI